MADSKVSGLPPAETPLTGAELVYLVQGGGDFQATAQDIADLADSSPGSGVRSITAGFDAGRVNGVDQALVAGLRVELRAVSGLTPVQWTLLPKAGSTGDITVDVRKRPFASGTFNAITDGSPPSISSGARGTASAAAWDEIDDGELIEFEVTAVTGTVTGITLIIEATES